MFVDCKKDIHISPEKPDKHYDLGDILTCLTLSKHGFGQRYKWTDSVGVIVSNSSMMTLTCEGSFNLTCTITDERPACNVLRVSISGHVYGKLTVNLNSYLIK